MKNAKVNVKIDGKETVLTKVYECCKYSQYNTPNSTQAHTFSVMLEHMPKGKKFITNGSTYEII